VPAGRPGLLSFFRLRTLGSGLGVTKNLRHVNLRLGQIEAALVGIIELGDVLIGNVDLGRDFFIEQLLDASGLCAVVPSNASTEHPCAGSKLLLKFFQRIGRLQLGELRIHVGVDCQ